MLVLRHGSLFLSRVFQVYLSTEVIIHHELDRLGVSRRCGRRPPVLESPTNDPAAVSLRLPPVDAHAEMLLGVISESFVCDLYTRRRDHLPNERPGADHVGRHGFGKPAERLLL